MLGDSKWLLTGFYLITLGHNLAILVTHCVVFAPKGSETRMKSHSIFKYVGVSK